jgi:CRP-like cAMP-binding protein
MPDTENQQSLSTTAARVLTTTTKTVPQMQGISSRWLLRILPWVQVSGGTYRVNRRLSYPVGDGRVSFVSTAAAVQVIPGSLRELPLLRDFDDQELLNNLAGRFTQREVAAGEVVVEPGRPAEQWFLIAHGKANKLTAGKYGEQAVLAVLADGDHFGTHTLLAPEAQWEFTVKALTPLTLLVLTRPQFQELLNQSGALRTQVEQFRTRPKPAQNKHGEAAIEVAAGHAGEPTLPRTFADYEASPREYPLSVAQTVLRVHTRVADLYNDPMNQTEQQLRLILPTYCYGSINLS